MTYTAEAERDCAENKFTDVLSRMIVNELEKSSLMRFIDTIHK